LLKNTYGRKYFPTLDSEQAYLRNPKKLANYVYGNREGNGKSESGDGWNFRGSGLIQLTFKNNYQAVGAKLGLDLISNPDAVRNDPEVAVRAALQYWSNNRLNKYADKGDYKGLTYNVNRGMLEYHKRVEITQNALILLNQQAKDR
jgi:putative chitinase